MKHFIKYESSAVEGTIPALQWQIYGIMDFFNIHTKYL